jgi:acyl dehydratase
MLVVDNPLDLKAHVGEELEPSDWVTVDQPTIDKFADATGDHQWIHVDVERAARHMPDGKTIAHGYLTLSLLPRMLYQSYEVKNRAHSLNYGSNKVRFTAPVAVGSRVRMRMTFAAVEEVANGGVRVTSNCVMEIEGSERPALVAEVISQIHA